MDLDEMKNIWENEPGKNDFTLYDMGERSSELHRRMDMIRLSEVLGLTVAYILAAGIIYYFNELDNWYLQLSGIILLLYFLIMPLYTISVVRKMRKPDLMQSNYKEVLEHFYGTRSKLKWAEKITFIANPFLFVSSTIVITKIYAGLDVFTLNLGLPVIIFIVVVFIGTIWFNMWTFRKREKLLQSVTQLLEQDN